MTPAPINITPEAYHAATDWISKSMLSVFADAPRKFQYFYLEGHERPQTDALRLGSAVHLYALERDKWDANYYVMPANIRRDARTKAYQEQIEAAGTREILKPSEVEQVEGMAESLLRNRKAVALLTGDKLIEHSIFWKDQEHGVNLRCRPDVIRMDNGIIVNLKTASSAKPESFFRTAFDFHYDVSVAMECRGYQEATGKPAAEYVFLVIETEPPYMVEAYNSFETLAGAPMTYRDLGEYRLRTLLQRLTECQKENRWLGYTDNITPMQAPTWKLRGLEDK